MKVLGAVIAGGRSSRFGSDKANAVLAGETLLNRAIKSLAPHCDAMVIVGRPHDTHLSLVDWPRTDMGPLGGLAAAMIHARHGEFDAVLSMAMDGAMLNRAMVAALHPAPAHLSCQPVIGLWPVQALDALQAILMSDGRHSMMRLCAAIESRAVSEYSPDNINTPEDLMLAEARLKGH